MNDLFFKRDKIETRSKALTFDDVLLVPQYSEISSRRHTDLKTQVTKNHFLKIPVVSANMDTITEKAMAVAMAELGGLGILHRFLSAEEQVRDLREIKNHIRTHQLEVPVAASIGVKEEGLKRAEILLTEGVDILTIDIAHGDSIMMIETLKQIKKLAPKIDVIAGNVATPEAVKRLIDCGADAVKVGIGPGSMCTTRIITGHGLPQLTAIALCVTEARKHGIPVIADGGIRNSGDIVKALVAGASCVMLGSMLSGTLETPGEIHGGHKTYRGMASRSAQISWRGELPEGMAPEGEATLVAVKGSVKDVLNEVCGGIRSGMTYLGVDNIKAMSEAGVFTEMSSAGVQESHAHGVRK